MTSNSQCPSLFKFTTIAALLLPLLGANLYAAPGHPVAVRWWGQAMVSIETYWNLRIVIDPYGLKIGYDDPKLTADLVLITHEHGDHNNADIVKAAHKAVHALDGDGKVKRYDLILDRLPNQPKATLKPTAEAGKPSKHAVRVRTMPSFHDDVAGDKRGHNGLWIIDVDGLRIVHCGDLGQLKLTDEQLKGLGQVDVLIIPVGGVYTVDGKQAGEIVKQIKPRIVVPIHYKTDVLKFKLQKLDPFLEALADSHKTVRTKSNTLGVSKGHGPTKQKPQLAVLKHLQMTPLLVKALRENQQFRNHHRRLHNQNQPSRLHHLRKSKQQSPSKTKKRSRSNSWELRSSFPQPPRSPS